MSEKLDAGTLLAQRAVEIRPGEPLTDLYRECFSISADVVMDALDKIRRGDFSPVDTGGTRSYYSFPTDDHWKEFRRRGGRFA